MSGIAPCPFGCGEYVLVVRNRRYADTADPLRRAGYLDREPEAYDTVAPVGFGGERVEAMARLGEEVRTVDHRLVSPGFTLDTPAFVHPGGRLKGHRVHRYRCPAWPAIAAQAPIRRFDKTTTKEAGKP